MSLKCSSRSPGSLFLPGVEVTEWGVFCCLVTASGNLLVLLRGEKSTLEKLFRDRGAGKALIAFPELTWRAAAAALRKRGLTVILPASVTKTTYRNIRAALRSSGIEEGKLYTLDELAEKLPSWLRVTLESKGVQPRKRREGFLYILGSPLPHYIVRKAEYANHVEDIFVFKNRVVIGVGFSFLSIKRFKDPVETFKLLAEDREKLTALAQYSDFILKAYNRLEERNILPKEEIEAMRRLVTFARLATV